MNAVESRVAAALAARAAQVTAADLRPPAPPTGATRVVRRWTRPLIGLAAAFLGVMFVVVAVLWALRPVADRVEPARQPGRTSPTPAAPGPDVSATPAPSRPSVSPDRSPATPPRADPQPQRTVGPSVSPPSTPRPGVPTDVPRATATSPPTPASQPPVTPAAPTG